MYSDGIVGLFTVFVKLNVEKVAREDVGQARL